MFESYPLTLDHQVVQMVGAVILRYRRSQNLDAFVEHNGAGGK